MTGRRWKSKIQDADGREIISRERKKEIEECFARSAAWTSRIDPIRPLLDRLEKGGRYAAIAYDLKDGKIVFINHDRTRAAFAPENLARLFGIVPDRATPASRT